MRVAVIGARGQVGSEVVSAAQTAGLDVLSLSHADCEITDRDSLAHSLAGLSSGDAVVNTAAFHRTDQCELEPRRAFAVNAVGAGLAASSARERGAAIVYLSSDFVFDGGKRAPYVESDEPNPINTYGASKMTGEAATRLMNGAHYVARISSVFGPAGSSGKGGNFVETMVARARRGERVEVVDDIVMAPTSAADAARLLVALLKMGADPGVYHLANAGQCSWREFADAIFELCSMPVRARPLRADDRPAPAARPRYSVLASEKLGALGLSARPWRAALAEYLELRSYRARE